MRVGITARPHKQRKLVRSMRKAATDRPGFMFDFSDLTEAKLNWRRNLLNYTGDITGLGILTRITVESAGAGPVDNAWRIIEDTSNGTHQIDRTVPLSANTVYTSSVYAKAGGRGFLQLNYAGYTQAVFNVAAGTVFSVAAANVAFDQLSAGIDAVPGFPGWYRCWVTRRCISALPSSSLRTMVSPNGSSFSYQGETTADILLSAPQTEIGPLTAYQKLTDVFTEFMSAFPYHSLFRENTFVTPVMALEDPIGGALDLRFGGLRSDLNIYGTNVPSFGVDWTRTGEEFKHTPGANSNLTFGAGGSAVVGRWYEFSFKVSGRTAGNVRGLAGSTSAGPYTALNGYYRFIGLCAGAPSMYINSDNAFDGTVSEIVVREVYGSHAYQVTPGDRPAVSARVNLVNASEDFTQTPWVRSGGVVINASAYVAPSGRAASAVFHGGAGSSAISLNATNAKATRYHCIFCVRAGTAATLSLGIRDITANTWAPVTAEILSGPGAVSGSAICFANGLTAEWTTIKLTTTADMTAGNLLGPFIYPVGTGTYATTQSVGVAFFQLAQGTVTLPYQRVGSATDYDYVGFAMGARFNGVNQYLRVTSYDPSAHSKAVVGLSMRKDSDAAISIPMEHTSTYNTTVGGWAVFAPSDVNFADAGIGINAGAPSARASHTVYGAPRTLVVSSNLNMAGNNPVDRGDVRVNSLVASNRGLLGSAGIGTAKFAVGETFIGRRGGSSFPFNGMIYRAGARYGEYDATTSFLMDRWLNEKLGVLPSEVFLNTVSKWFTAANTPGRFEPGFRDWATSGALFQDSLFTTPVTALEQSVGGRIDRSRGMAVSTAEQFSNSGPVFSSIAGWVTNGTLSVVGGKLRVTATATGALRATTGTGSAVGKLYAGQVAVSTSTMPTQTGAWQFSTAAGVLALAPAGSAARVDSFKILAPATYYVGVTATATSIGDYFDIDFVSSKEILGAHRIQPTNSKRPVLSARKNWLLRTEAFSDASAWAKGAGGTGTAPVFTDAFGIAPDGTQTATRVVMALNGGTTTADISRFQQSVATTNGSSWAQAVWLKTNDGSTKVVSFRDDFGLSVNQLLTVTPTWQQFTFVGALSTNNAINACPIWIRGSIGTADSVDLLIWHPQIERAAVGAQPGRYQKVNTATDYDSVGFPVGLRYDGLTMGMYTAAPIDYSATDKITVAYPIFKVSDAAAAVLYEHGPNSATTDGTFGMLAPHNTNVTSVSPIGRGTIPVQFLGTLAAPASAVVRHSIDIPATPKQALSVNGTVNTTSNSLGTGNFTSQIGYEGARLDASLRFNGMVFAEFQIGKLLTASELTYLEAEFAKLLLEQ